MCVHAKKDTSILNVTKCIFEGNRALLGGAIFAMVSMSNICPFQMVFLNSANTSMQSFVLALDQFKVSR